MAEFVKDGTEYNPIKDRIMKLTIDVIEKSNVKKQQVLKIRILQNATELYNKNHFIPYQYPMQSVMQESLTNYIKEQIIFDTSAIDIAVTEIIFGGTI